MIPKYTIGNITVSAICALVSLLARRFPAYTKTSTEVHAGEQQKTMLNDTPGASMRPRDLSSTCAQCAWSIRAVALARLWGNLDVPEDVDAPEDVLSPLPSSPFASPCLTSLNGFLVICLLQHSNSSRAPSQWRGLLCGWRSRLYGLCGGYTTLQRSQYRV